MPSEANVHQRNEKTQGRCIDRVDEARGEQGIEAVVQVEVGVAECFDDDVKELGDLRTFDDGTDLRNCLQSSLMDFLVGIVEHLSQRLDDVRKEAEDLLWCTQRHVADCLDGCQLRPPIIVEEPLEEDRHDLLDRVAAQAAEDLLIRSVGADADLLARISNAVHDVGQNLLDKWLECLALHEG